MAPFLHQLQLLDPLLIYAVIFAVAFIENLFPPSPSDMVIVFAGSLVGVGVIGFPGTLISATLGSTLGFATMYKIGDWFGVHILESRRFSFIPLESVKKAEAWFLKYGYWLIVANRFLAGTRAIVSFFAGMSELAFWKTTVLCFLSALLWNAILVTGGYYLGRNWGRIGFYMVAYSRAVTAIVVVVAVLLIVRYFLKKKTRTPEP